MQLSGPLCFNSLTFHLCCCRVVLVHCDSLVACAHRRPRPRPVTPVIDAGVWFETREAGIKLALG